MVFWEPRTVAEKKLLELYAAEEDDIQVDNQNRSHGDGRKEIPVKNLRRLAG